MTDGREAFQGRARGVAEDYAGAVGAAGARLSVRAGLGRALTLASVGEQWATSPPAVLPAGAASMAADRMAFSVALGNDAVAVVELAAAAAAPFTVEQAQLARAGGEVMACGWQASPAARGRRLALPNPQRPPPPPFEDEMRTELERARRLSLNGGVLVASVPGSGGIPDPRVLSVVIQVVRGELRSSDLLGQLAGGDIAAVLVRTSAEGVAVAAERVRQRLDGLAREHQLPPVVVGHALYPAVRRNRRRRWCRRRGKKRGSCSVEAQLAMSATGSNRHAIDNVICCQVANSSNCHCPEAPECPSKTGWGTGEATCASRSSASCGDRSRPSSTCPCENLGRGGALVESRLPLSARDGARRPAAARRPAERRAGEGAPRDARSDAGRRPVPDWPGVHGPGRCRRSSRSIGSSRRAWARRSRSRRHELMADAFLERRRDAARRGGGRPAGRRADGADRPPGGHQRRAGCSSRRRRRWTIGQRARLQTTLGSEPLNVEVEVRRVAEARTRATAADATAWAPSSCSPTKPPARSVQHFLRDDAAVGQASSTCSLVGQAFAWQLSVESRVASPMA